MSDDFFAPPPFSPETALANLRRTLRELRLTERGGAFELAGEPVVQARPVEGALVLQIARRPSRSPQWEHFTVHDHAQLRRHTEEIKRRLARWSEGED